MPHLVNEKGEIAPFDFRTMDARENHATVVLRGVSGFIPKPGDLVVMVEQYRATQRLRRLRCRVEGCAGGEVRMMVVERLEDPESEQK